MLRSFYIICALYINISKKNIIIFTPLRHHHHYLTTLETLRLESLVNNVNDCWSKMLKLGRAVHINKAATNTAHTATMTYNQEFTILTYYTTFITVLWFNRTSVALALLTIWLFWCLPAHFRSGANTKKKKKLSSKLWVSIHITAAIHLR